METLLEKVKANLILGHDQDDALINQFIKAAVSYAESFQHIPAGSYGDDTNKNNASESGVAVRVMPPTTEQAVIMLASHFYESRDGSTAGFYADSVQAGQQVWKTVNLLLRLDKEWVV